MFLKIMSAIAGSFGAGLDMGTSGTEGKVLLGGHRCAHHAPHCGKSCFYSREGHARAFYGAHTSRRPL